MGVILFNVYYPVLGIYILILADKFLREWERTKMNLVLTQTDDDMVTVDDGVFNLLTEPTTNYWLPPLAATFVGCIAMMFFTFFQVCSSTSSLRYSYALQL